MSKRQASEPATSAAKRKPAVVSSSDSSDSSSESEDEKKVNISKKVATPAAKPAPKKKAESSSSDSSSSSEDEIEVKKQPQKRKAESDSDDDAPVVKRDRKSLPVASLPKTPSSEHTKKDVKASSEPRPKNEPFRRVKSEEVYVDPRLRDNSYDAKSGAAGGYGQKANEILIHTKGKSFRHEKTKKKRGTYIGGEIDQSVHSIKFDDNFFGDD